MLMVHHGAVITRTYNTSFLFAQISKRYLSIKKWIGRKEGREEKYNIISVYTRMRYIDRVIVRYSTEWINWLISSLSKLVSLSFRSWNPFTRCRNKWPDCDNYLETHSTTPCLSGVYTSNLFNDLDFYLGQILYLYEAKYLGQIFFPNFLLHRGAIFGPNKFQIV